MVQLFAYLTVTILLEKEALLPREEFPNLFFLRILWLPSSLMRLPEETKTTQLNLRCLHIREDETVANIVTRTK